MATRYVARHEECGFVGTPASKGRAARALRDHSCERGKRRATGERRPLPAAGDPCGLSIDLDADMTAPSVGDWVVTQAGSRYLVTACQAAQPRTPEPLVRYRLRCTRLAWQCPVPAGVRVIEPRWCRQRPPTAKSLNEER